jgi:GNAT superfamily N-acetyltransferase
MIVRPARPDEAQALASLRWEFRSSVEEPTEARDVFVARCADWMRAALSPGEPWCAWVAVAGESIVGQIWAQRISKLPNPVDERELHAYISNLYVSPEARGGTGTQLLEAALAWADAQKVDRVILWPTERSRSLYERFGFRGDGNVMERSTQR